MGRDISICFAQNQDNVSEWGDISICWSGIRITCPSGVTYLSVGPGIRIMCPSGVTYLSVGPESG